MWMSSRVKSRQKGGIRAEPVIFLPTWAPTWLLAQDLPVNDSFSQIKHLYQLDLAGDRLLRYCSYS